MRLGEASFLRPGFRLWAFLAYLVVMKFLRDKNLRQLGVYLFALTVLIFVVQHFILGFKLDKLSDVEHKREYTRLTQLTNHQISLSVVEFLRGNQALAPQILSMIEEQDRRLIVLDSGGRIDNTNEFISPLNRLARITFSGLRDDWNEMKGAINLMLVSDNASVEASSSNGVPSLLKFQGMSLTLSNWFDKLMVDLSEDVAAQRSSVDLWRTLFIVFNVLYIVTIGILTYIFIVKPIQTLQKNTLAQTHTLGFPPNELGDLANAINHTIENLRDATEFITQIGHGNLSLSYRDNFDHDYVEGQNKLADSLLDMQQKLKALNEEEQRRKWANDGLARFVDILRSSNDNVHALCDQIIRALVQYTKSNQGALYILNDEGGNQKYLELISLFAYDQKKYETQRIKPGQGLLGQTFLERETTYLTDLPEEYIRITSGLGGAQPKCLLVVPLKVDQEVYGLVELASFQLLEQHEIAFVEKLGETIASTLGSVRAAQKNKHLIEQFQQQTEQMRAQEEEMRQNMEELQATQEEIIRKEKSYISRIEELEKLVQENSSSALEVTQLRTQLDEAERAYQNRLAQLQSELAKKSGSGEEWERIQELEKTFRINLEAIRITADELHRKG